MSNISMGFPVSTQLVAGWATKPATHVNSAWTSPVNRHTEEYQQKLGE